MKKAVLLLSGGIDSATCGAIAKEMGFELYALTIDYGQRHRIEIEASERMAALLEVKRHIIIPLDLRPFGGSALTSDIDVPKSQDPMDRQEIPITYVPARNTIFLSLALGYAESIGAFDIFIGANQVDFSGYPDCREEYIEAFERMANLALKATVEGRGKVKIHAPLIHMNKAEIILKAASLGLDLSLTHSCYDPLPDGRACGLCDSCHIRRRGFLMAGIKDPTRYG